MRFFLVSTTGSSRNDVNKAIAIKINSVNQRKHKIIQPTAPLLLLHCFFLYFGGFQAVLIGSNWCFWCNTIHHQINSGNLNAKQTSNLTNTPKYNRIPVADRKLTINQSEGFRPILDGFNQRAGCERPFRPVAYLKQVLLTRKKGLKTSWYVPG